MPLYEHRLYTKFRVNFPAATGNRQVQRLQFEPVHHNSVISKVQIGTRQASSKRFVSSSEFYVSFLGEVFRASSFQPIAALCSSPTTDGKRVACSCTHCHSSTSTTSVPTTKAISSTATSSYLSFTRWSANSNCPSANSCCRNHISIHRWNCAHCSLSRPRSAAIVPVKHSYPTRRNEW